MSDLRFALRSLGRSPGFTAIAIATLAVAIGVNSAIYSLVNGLFLRPLVPDRPAKTVNIFTARKAANRDWRQFSYAEFTSLRETDPVFQDVRRAKHFPGRRWARRSHAPQFRVLRVRQFLLVSRCPAGRGPVLHRRRIATECQCSRRRDRLFAVAAHGRPPGFRRQHDTGQRTGIHRHWRHSARIHRHKRDTGTRPLAAAWHLFPILESTGRRGAPTTISPSPPPTPSTLWGG